MHGPKRVGNAARCVRRPRSEAKRLLGLRRMDAYAARGAKRGGQTVSIGWTGAGHRLVGAGP